MNSSEAVYVIPWTVTTVRGDKNPGIKLNSKVVIFDNHLAPIYNMRVKQ
jgi:hypothetical protein